MAAKFITHYFKQCSIEKSAVSASKVSLGISEPGVMIIQNELLKCG